MGLPFPVLQTALTSAAMIAIPQSVYRRKPGRSLWWCGHRTPNPQLQETIGQRRAARDVVASDQDRSKEKPATRVQFALWALPPKNRQVWDAGSFARPARQARRAFLRSSESDPWDPWREPC